MTFEVNSDKFFFNVWLKSSMTLYKVVIYVLKVAICFLEEVSATSLCLSIACSIFVFDDFVVDDVNSAPFCTEDVKFLML